jgi:MFS family permease
MFRTFVIAVLGFFASAVLSYLVVVLGVSAWWDFNNVHDQDGGGHMALGLVIGPFCAVIGGLVGAFIVPLGIARWRGKRAPATEVEKTRDMRRFIILGTAIVGGMIGYYLAQFGFWLVSPIQYDNYWKVWAVSWVPTILMMLGALVGALAARKPVNGIPKAQSKR